MYINTHMYGLGLLLCTPTVSLLDDEGDFVALNEHTRGTVTLLSTALCVLCVCVRVCVI